jgi:hypothetical protein
MKQHTRLSANKTGKPEQLQHILDISVNKILTMYLSKANS